MRAEEPERRGLCDLDGPDWESGRCRGDRHAIVVREDREANALSVHITQISRIITRKPDVRFCFEGSDIEVFTN